jgi:hypothetical protein
MNASRLHQNHFTKSLKIQAVWCDSPGLVYDSAQRKKVAIRSLCNNMKPETFQNPTSQHLVPSIAAIAPVPCVFLWFENNLRLQRFIDEKVDHE